MGSTSPAIEFSIVPPDTDDARAVLRAYYDDIVSRYYGRQATDGEIESAMRDEPNDDLHPPRGLFLVAIVDDVIVGCAGLRLRPAGVAELTRVFLAPEARGRGVAARLVGELEDHARRRGIATVRMDTRRDLVEARRLYARLGYREVQAFNADPYADHFFAKALDQS
jgi:GNAT superfamily N-acetyltransferase